MEVDGGDGHGGRGASKLRFHEREVGWGKSVSFDGEDCGCRVCTVVLS